MNKIIIDLGQTTEYEFELSKSGADLGSGTLSVMLYIDIASDFFHVYNCIQQPNKIWKVSFDSNLCKPGTYKYSLKAFYNNYWFDLLSDNITFLQTIVPPINASKESKEIEKQEDITNDTPKVEKPSKKQVKEQQNIEEEIVVENIVEVKETPKKEIKPIIASEIFLETSKNKKQSTLQKLSDGGVTELKVKEILNKLKPTN